MLPPNSNGYKSRLIRPKTVFIIAALGLLIYSFSLRGNFDGDLFIQHYQHLSSKFNVKPLVTNWLNRTIRLHGPLKKLLTQVYDDEEQRSVENGTYSTDTGGSLNTPPTKEGSPSVNTQSLIVNQILTTSAFKALTSKIGNVEAETTAAVQPTTKTTTITPTTTTIITASTKAIAAKAPSTTVKASTTTTTTAAAKVKATKFQSTLDKTDFVKTASPTCASWRTGINWSKPVKPTVHLNSEKYLYPGLIWGPNNQIVGLWQSMYLAIRLNRTLILPYFHSHFTNGGEKRVTPDERLDGEKIRQFMSTISVEEANKRCGGSFDVALQAMSIRWVETRQFELDTDMKVFNPTRNRTYSGSTRLRLNDNDVKPPPSIPTFPGENYTVTYQPWLTSDKSTLLKAYSTSAECAVYVGPFFTIRIGLKDNIASPLPANLSGVISYDEIPDDVMYSAVVDAVRRPLCIEEAAKAYIEETYNNEEYAAIHWRYDKKDWGRRCEGVTSDACTIVQNVTPAHLATAIVSEIRAAENRTFKYAYIATPPAIRDFRDEALSEIVKQNPDFINTKGDITTFLTTRYESCWENGRWENLGEIVSLVEMELMRNSQWFFHSLGSTWSSNVRPIRLKSSTDGVFVRKFEVSVLDAVSKVQKINVDIN
uniref:uncharacterized protein LOC108950060 n=1 Tax=Ciona intestinalis TaxID=7719 RepID=UPI00089DCB7F|nr:uncharacterized protein LOC108950060 [Ciona intestinalis]|eukprot:XP_018670283.1 uncharacterized protein LOC108950060 [Ciona intestinalis]